MLKRVDLNDLFRAEFPKSNTDPDQLSERVIIDMIKNKNLVNKYDEVIIPAYVKFYFSQRKIRSFYALPYDIQKRLYSFLEGEKSIKTAYLTGSFVEGHWIIDENDKLTKDYRRLIGKEGLSDVDLFIPGLKVDLPTGFHNNEMPREHHLIYQDGRFY